MIQPFASHVVDDWGVQGDASGNPITMTVLADPRFAYMVSYATVSVLQAVPTNLNSRVAFSRDNEASIGFHELLISTTVNPANITKTHIPPPFIWKGGGLGRIVFASSNTDADVYRIAAEFLLFNLEARHTTPLGHLLYGRGSN